MKVTVTLEVGDVDGLAALREFNRLYYRVRVSEAGTDGVLWNDMNRRAGTWSMEQPSRRDTLSNALANCLSLSIQQVILDHLEQDQDRGNAVKEAADEIANGLLRRILP